MDISSVDELLTTTRAVRKRLDLTRQVDRDVILDCVRLAMQAPTASNAQDWRWVVVTDADKRAAIAEIYRSIGAEYLAHAASNRTDPQTRRVYAECPRTHRDASQGSCSRNPLSGKPFRRKRPAGRRVGLGIDHPGRLELSARASIPWSGIGMDDDASGQGA